MKRKTILMLVFAVVAFSLFANDNLLLANVPIKYGEEKFIERIEERTGGTREPVGLVLSGGSARAFAHIGVLKYMEEAGIVPDFIISNSMGSIIALMYSAGFSPDQIMEIVTNVNIAELFSLSLPVNSGILGSAEAKAYISSFMPDGLKIEDLEIPVMVICEDLVTKRQIQIMEGDWADVMIASFAIPFYFSSVEYKDHLLIDGGTANIAPLDIAYQYAPFNIISTSFYNNTTLNLKNSITALNVSIDIGKSRQGITDILNHPDDSIWIRCDVEGFSYMEFSAIDQLAERGYASAKSTLETEKSSALLADLPHGGVSEEMIEERAVLQQTIEKRQNQYQYYRHIGTTGFTQAFTVGGKSFAYPSDPYSLRDDTIIGLTYGFKLKDWSVDVLAGFSWQAFNFGPAVPAINFSQTLFLTPGLKLATDISFFQDSSSLISPYSPVCYLMQGIDYTFPILGDFRFQLRGSYELVNNFNSKENDITIWNGLAHLLSVSGIYHYQKDITEVYVEAGMNVPFWNNSIREFPFITIRSASELGTPYLRLSAFVTTRFCLDGLGNVPFLVRDSFRTNNSSILRQGSPNKEFDNPKNFLVSSTVSLGYVPFPNQSVSFGEILLLNNNYITAYCDLIWYKADSNPSVAFTPAVSPGLELHSDVSLIGLRTVSVTAFLGYDGPSNGIVGGFWFSSAE